MILFCSLTSSFGNCVRIKMCTNRMLMLVGIDAGLVHVGCKVTEAERCDGGVQQQQ